MSAAGTTTHRARAARWQAVVAGALVVLGAAIAVDRLTSHYQYGNDFDVYWVAGRAFLHHHSLFGPWLGQHIQHPLPFTYPPVAAVFAVPFALVGDVFGYVVWNLLSIALLVLVVRASTRAIVARSPYPRATLALLVLLALALTPVQDELGFGQVGIALMALCLFDCTGERPRWPRGALVGVATAVKLIPGIFVPYLWLSGRRRAALTACATFVVVTGVGAVLLPGDSRTFWTSRLFDNSRVGNNAYMSNQSLDGMIRRALGWGTGAQLLWIGLVVAVAAFGLLHAARASRAGEELRGVCLVGLTAILVSPVSWIHHLVWVVPALAVLAGDATEQRRTAWTLAFAAWFTLRLPYFGDDGTAARWHLGWAAPLLRDAFGLACVALLIVLARPKTRERVEVPAA